MNRRRILPQIRREQEEEDDLFDYAYHKPGLMPGTITIDQDAAPSKIDLIDYNEAKAIRLTNIKPEECQPYLDKESISWVDLAGLGSEDVLLKIREIFNFHPLTIETIVNVPQRPKIEFYQDHLLIVTQMVMLKDREDGFEIEQVSLILGRYYLLTVQEEPERDCFNLVRDRIMQNAGTIRQRGPEFLAYAIWDAIVDGYFPVLEALEKRLEDLEDEILFNPNNKSLGKVYAIKRELLALRRAIWPQRNSLNVLLRDEIFLDTNELKPYLRDCYDNMVQVVELIEIYRELTASLMEVYLSSISNRMNEVMKILTVISTIFIPLTFVAGVYGMNFNPESSPWNMPELDWYWGYPLCLGSMFLIACTLIYFFWRRGWFKNVTKIDRSKTAY